MSLTSRQTNDFLNGLDALYREALATIDCVQLRRELKKSKKLRYLGILRNSEDLKDIEAARQFFPPSSYYGHKYGNSVAAYWDVRPGCPADLYCTDKDGILKNDIYGEDARNRIVKAKKDKRRLIFFFGGSTMMSMGAQTPNFSIPSLVQRICETKFKEEIECINFGLGGTCSKDALNLLIHESLRLGHPSDVVFYDGWNCASYLSVMELLRKKIEALDDTLILRYGESVRHVEHNFTLSETYNSAWCLTRFLKLELSRIASFCIQFVPNKIVRSVLLGFQNKFFDLRPSRKFSSLLSAATNNISEADIREVAEIAAANYIEIHRYANAVCSDLGVRFNWFQQPLVFWGNKPLTKSESEWKTTGYSSGDPRFFDFFEAFFHEKFKSLQGSSDKLAFRDLTEIFDCVSDEVYIDSGHLNRLGNLFVSSAIAEFLRERGGCACLTS
jgi:hypothetical protein